MSERKPERYRWHPDMDRSTAADRPPTGDGMSIGVDDNWVILPPPPPRPDGFAAALARQHAHREKMRRIHARVWLGIFLAALVLGSLLMVAVAHG